MSEQELTRCAYCGFRKTIPSDRAVCDDCRTPMTPERLNAIMEKQRGIPQAHEIAELVEHIDWQAQEIATLTAERDRLREVNLNDYVWVKLKDKGRAMLRDQDERWSRLYATSYGRLPVAEQQEQENGGWSRWQLWSLIESFGSALYLGCDPPFETTIRLDALASLTTVAGPTAEQQIIDRLTAFLRSKGYTETLIEMVSRGEHPQEET